MREKNLSFHLDLAVTLVLRNISIKIHTFILRENSCLGLLSTHANKEQFIIIHKFPNNVQFIFHKSKDTQLLRWARHI
jgi:hypothetical protein